MEAAVYMKHLFNSLVVNGFVIVEAERVDGIMSMAERVGLCVCGGALIERDGRWHKVLYHEQRIPAWYKHVEELLHDRSTIVSQADMYAVLDVARTMGMCVHGGALIERGAAMVKVLYC